MMPNTLFGITSILCFSLPIVAILYFRLYRHASLIALMLYYALTILRCIGSNTVPPSPVLTNVWEVLYSYLETPLMLLALLFFCPAKQRQQKIHIVMGLFVVYEGIIALLFGFTPFASWYITAPGLAVIVLYSLFLFLRQLKFTLMHGKNAGRVLMLGAILFSYSCYLYLFYAYFIEEKPDISGIYALHFVSSSITSVMMAAGLYLMRHRIKELQELKVTRRELQMIFGS
jgi:uncharacterized protein with PQ loop repeat